MKPFNHQKGKYFHVMNANIYIEETGISNGFPFIFLHGGLGTIRDFSSLIERINGNYRFIGVETRGHGKSTLGTQSLSYELLENDLSTILEYLGISKCIILGYSDGGIIAYRIAIKKPLLVSKLITIGADWNPPSLSLQKLYSSLTFETWQKKFPETIALYEQLNPEANFNFLLKSIIPMWLDRSHSGYPDNKVKKIQCDTLIIRGDNDPLIPRNAITHLDKYFSKATFLNIPFAGHTAHVDQCEVVSMLINQFLQH
ncbi:MAG: alpha/beta hydrolase [Proteobacteria bacterium]|nr:alpha/beta hydrolase [Pseudomonadota bacterium]